MLSHKLNDTTYLLEDIIGFVQKKKKEKTITNFAISNEEVRMKVFRKCCQLF